MGGTCAAVCYVLLQAIRLDVRTLPAPVRQQHRSVNAASDMGRPLVIESKTFSVYGAAYWGRRGGFAWGASKQDLEPSLAGRGMKRTAWRTAAPSSSCTRMYRAFWKCVPANFEMVTTRPAVTWRPLTIGSEAPSERALDLGVHGDHDAGEGGLAGCVGFALGTVASGGGFRCG